MILKNNRAFQFIGKAITIIGCSLLVSCSYVNDMKWPFWHKKTLSCRQKYELSGEDIYADAQLAATAYESDRNIQAFCKKLGYSNLAIGMVSNLQLKYFTATANDAQYIVIRGTSNFANVKSDILATPVFDALSNIWLHKGFRDAALAIFQNLEQAYPRIHPAKKTIIIGHSLGGAIANILGIYLYQNNFYIDRIMTFGQPKITDKKGLAAYPNLPLFRVVGDGDMIACVPPKTDVFTYVHGGLKIFVDDKNVRYTHFGDPSNGVEDNPVSIHMDLDRVSRSAYHKISYYLKRLKTHQERLRIQVKTP